TLLRPPPNRAITAAAPTTTTNSTTRTPIVSQLTVVASEMRDASSASCIQDSAAFDQVPQTWDAAGHTDARTVHAPAARSISPARKRTARFTPRFVAFMTHRPSLRTAAPAPA